eukprot:6205458-Pleurochrysis_carterae.AAC.2
MASPACMPIVTVEAMSRERQALDAAAKVVRRGKRDQCMLASGIAEGDEGVCRRAGFRTPRGQPELMPADRLLAASVGVLPGVLF